MGGGGNDILVGGIGNDVVYGDAPASANLDTTYHGDDILYGEAGDDQLVGGAGNDTLIDESLAGESVNLAGEAGDDRYELTGEGSINLYDNQSYNSIVLGVGDSLEGAGLAPGANGTGYIVSLANGHSPNIQNGFFGTAGTVQDANGTEVDLEGGARTAVTGDLRLRKGDAANECEWMVAA